MAEYIGYDAIDPDATADDVGRLTVLAAGPVGINLAVAHGCCLDEPWTDHDVDAHYAMQFGLAEQIVASGASAFPAEFLVSSADAEARALVEAIFSQIDQLASTLDQYTDPDNLTIERIHALTREVLKDRRLPIPSASPFARKCVRICAAGKAVAALDLDAGLGGIAIDTRTYVTCAVTAMDIGPEPLMDDGTESFLKWMSVFGQEQLRRGWNVVARAGQAAVAKLQAIEVTASNTTTVDDPDVRDLVDRLWPAILAVECHLPQSGLVSVDEIKRIIERSTT